MAAVHKLIVEHGVEEARRQALTPNERAVVETAYQVLSEEADRIGYTYAGFALTSLPHREHKNRIWRREGYNLTMVIQSGVDKHGKEVGVPFGPIARLILMFLQTEAIRTQSREIEIGRSMQGWLTKMGMSIGGKTYTLVKEQAKRIASCNLTFFPEGRSPAVEVAAKGAFVKASMFSNVAHDGQLTLWEDRVVLDDYFYKELNERPVPLSEEAIRAIGSVSSALDIYVWIAYRLHSLKDDTRISWLSLFKQFGSNYKEVRKWRERFVNSLAVALAAYPEARVSVEEEGLILHPSRPPISKLLR